MPRDQGTPKAQWDETMEYQFCLEYVDWKKTGKWDRNAQSESNWMRFGNHLNNLFGRSYVWGVYYSKLQRLRKIWRAYAKLKGKKGSAETGIGWDDDVKCFLADDQQWNNLVLENKDYVHFRFKQPVHKYDILSEVLEGEMATGSRAQASSAPPRQWNRLSQAATYSSGQQPTQDDSAEEIPPSNVDFSQPGGSKWAGKRPATSLGGTTSFTGSRGTKSSKSSENNPYVACAESLSTLATTKLKLVEARTMGFEQYDVTTAAQVVGTFKDVVPPGKRIKALQELQKDKWRRTFLTMERELQEYWLHSLKPADANDTPNGDDGGED